MQGNTPMLGLKMASGRKQKRTTNNLLMMRPGLRAQIPDSPSLSLASHGQHYLNAGYENTENLSEGQYEDLELYNQIPACPRKFNNAIYEQASPPTIPSEIKIERPERQRQFTECSDADSFSSLMHSRSKKSRCSAFLNVFTAITSLVSLSLVLLLAFGIMKTGGSCGCGTKSEYTQQHLTKISQAPSVSISVLVQMINRLERNVTSMLARDAAYRREIVELKSKFEVLRENPTEEPSTDHFKDNITTEVNQLREKQVQLHSSLTKLKKSDETQSTDIQEMSAKVIGLAVAVNFLSLNDSLIKSKVHKLSQSEVEFRSSIEALEQKDAAVDATLERAKGVEAFLNSSVNQLKSMDGLMKSKLDQLNSTFISKINVINSTVHKMKGGPGQPGPPGPPGPRGIPGTPGAGNLTQCQHQQKEFSGMSGKTADYYVNFIEPKDKVVMGATCSTFRGDETSLSSVTNSQGEKVYLCTCKGESNFSGNSGNTKCLIDVWVCPRIS